MGLGTLGQQCDISLFLLYIYWDEELGQQCGISLFLVYFYWD
jgi:hypothetical protein